MFAAVSRGAAAVVTLAALLNTSTAIAAAAPCTIANATPLSFDMSAIDSRRTVDGRASFTVTCPIARTESISLIYSHELLGSPTGASLRYDLYARADRTDVWGAGNDGAPVIRTFPAAEPTVVRVYARIPAQAPVAAGQFSDTIDVVMLP